MIDPNEPVQLIKEIFRVLKPNGIFYVTDFLICDHPRYQEKYAQGMREFSEMGIYTTNENLTVRHYTSSAILKLLKDFDVHWFEQFDFKTMNQNPARTFHCIAKKK